MYIFILSMWKQGKIDEKKVRGYCPKYITDEEVTKILATPQA